MHPPRSDPAPALVGLVLALAALLVAGCGGNTRRAGEDPSKQTATHGPTTEVLVEHDFTDPTSDVWIQAPGGAIRRGQLVLSARPDEVARSGAQRSLQVADVHVEAKVASDDIRGDDATFGVLCRWTFDAKGRSRDYYAFTVSPNGYAAIGTSRDFLWQAPEPVAHVKRGRGVVNELRAECVGDRLSLYVNRKLVQSVTDKLLASGDVGVTLENYGTRRRATARFDDFRAAQVL